MNSRKTQFLWQIALTQKWTIALSIFLGLSSSLFNGVSTALIVPIILEVMGENVTSKLPPILKVLFDPFQSLPDRYRVLAMSLFIILAIVLKSGSTYFNAVTAGKIVREIATKLRAEAMKIFFSVDLSFINGIKRGDLINRMTIEVDRAIQPIQIWIGIIVSSLNIFLFTTLLILLSWQLTLLLILLIPIPQLLTRALVKKSREYGDRVTTLNQDMASHFYEIVDGVKLVRSSCMEGHEYQKSLHYIHTKEKLMLNTQINNSLFGPISEVTNILIIFLLIWGGKLILQEEGNLTTILLPYLVTLYRLLPFINQINAQRSSLATYQSVLDLIIQFLDRDSKPFTASGERPFTGLKKGIQLKHISFCYPNSEELVLQDINLYLPKGTTLALVGASGSGKSTLADLIPRFYDPTEGTIEIDGCPLQAFNLESLRKSIGIVSQDTFVFNNTVRYNIAYGRDSVTDAEVEEAARRANAYDFIQELPEGFNTQIGNRGIRLSGGQRQRDCPIVNSKPRNFNFR
jgi:ABC-type multidrug transport system fused ATPase/permease subunit